MLNLLEIECPNSSPKSTYLSQGANSAIKPGYWMLQPLGRCGRHLARVPTERALHSTGSPSLVWSIAVSNLLANFVPLNNGTNDERHFCFKCYHPVWYDLGKTVKSIKFAFSS